MYSATIRSIASKTLISSPALKRSFLSSSSLVSRSINKKKWAPDSLISKRFFSAKSGLSDILGRELAEEEDNGSIQMPEELSSLKATLENDWKIVDEGASTRLIRSVGGAKVQVSFHCQDSVEFVDTEDEGEDPDEVEPDPAVRFTVTATKAGKSLVLGCISENATVRIQSAAVTSQDVETIQHNSGIDTSLYQGPEFSELAEDLQDAFHGYLESELGIGEDIAAFIAMQADFQEQSNYVKFLEDAKSII